VTEPGFTEEDLALFVDLDRAADGAGLRPCLIGAGAIQLGGAQRWNVRLARRTRDWDFAVRVESREEYEELAKRLTSDAGGFERAPEPHRFEHAGGGILDVVPYGGLERPRGTVDWGSGVSMSTEGFAVLDDQFETVHADSLELRSASLPALVGLKLLAYRDRRPGITRDIADVHEISKEVEHTVSHDRIQEHGMERLRSEDVGFGEIGAYLLGRDVGGVFEAADSEKMVQLLAEAEREDTAIAREAAGASATPREEVARRLRALRLGIVDGRG
jgi:predicted nucleotidyltransferase